MKMKFHCVVFSPVCTNHNHFLCLDARIHRGKSSFEREHKSTTHFLTQIRLMVKPWPKAEKVPSSKCKEASKGHQKSERVNFSVRSFAFLYFLLLKKVKTQKFCVPSCQMCGQWKKRLGREMHFLVDIKKKIFDVSFTMIWQEMKAKKYKLDAL